MKDIPYTPLYTTGFFSVISKTNIKAETTTPILSKLEHLPWRANANFINKEKYPKKMKITQYKFKR